MPTQAHLAETPMEHIATRARYGRNLTAPNEALRLLSGRFSGAHEQARSLFKGLLPTFLAESVRLDE